VTARTTLPHVFPDRLADPVMQIVLIATVFTLPEIYIAAALRAMTGYRLVSRAAS
jgi:hypothetical protein